MRNARALVVAGLVLAAPSAGPAATLDDVVRDLEGTYSRMIDLRAEFTQTAFNKSLNQTIPAQGTVYLKKGGKLRWEYKEPTPQEIVSDGKKLWVYTPALNQVNVGDAPEALAGPARRVQRPLLEPGPTSRYRRPLGARPHPEATAADARAPRPGRGRDDVGDPEGGRVRSVREHGDDALHERGDQLEPARPALHVRGPEGGRHRAAAMREKRAPQ